MSSRIIKEDIDNILTSNIDWKRFENSTILVSGGSGFLPAYIVETLLQLNISNKENNIKIVCIVRNIENAKIRFSEYLRFEFLEFLVQDVSEEINYVGDIHFIIHAASQASPKYYSSDPVGTLMSNTLGTINILNLARKKNVKSFLFFSSSEIYGKVESHSVPIKEDDYGLIDPMNIRSCYSESKKMGENICISYFHQFDIPVKIVRIFHSYGPGMKLDDGRIFADFARDVLNGDILHINSNGKSVRAYCYISDAVEAFFKTLLSDFNGHAFNIGNENQCYSVNQLAQNVQLLYPKMKIQRQAFTPENNISAQDSIITPDTSKAKEFLNWFPKVDFTSGFKRTIESYQVAIIP